jgi:hypothetical protein
MTDNRPEYKYKLGDKVKVTVEEWEGDRDMIIIGVPFYFMKNVLQKVRIEGSTDPLDQYVLQPDIEFTSR